MGGNKRYICSQYSVPVLKHRLGHNINIAGIPFGEKLNINGVCASFHPAGHIIGSAQIKIEKNGEICVISGDYKLEDDGISQPFEIVKCHHFITESTFGLPVYKWEPQSCIFSEINSWWSNNKENGKTSLISAYSLGKAQRILQGIDDSIGKIFSHGAINSTNQALRNAGIKLKESLLITSENKSDTCRGSIVIAPPSAIGSSWMKRFKDVSMAIASGWMALRGIRRRRGADRGFA